LALTCFPEKVMFKYGSSGNTEVIQNYQLDTHFNWQTIFLGLGLIVLWQSGVEIRKMPRAQGEADDLT